MRTPLGKGTYGPRGRSVALWIEGERIVAQWREQGARKKKSWVNTAATRAEAKAWAVAFSDARGGKRTAILTLNDLWELYAEDQFPVLRPKTRTLYTEAWRRWMIFAGHEQRADDLGTGTLARFKADMGRGNLSPNTMARTIQVVKTVYGWAHRHEHLTENRMAAYRFQTGKDERRERPGEYRREEFEALLAALPVNGAWTWRAHGVIALCGYQGSRASAVLHLRWEDIDFEAGTIRWRPEWDKVGKDETSPMRAGTRAVLEAIRHRTNGTGWVFPAATRHSKSPTYTIQAAWCAIKGAEKKAGVAPKGRRALHGLRRLLFNDVLDATGNVGAAMAAIRDTSLTAASKYLRPREDTVREAFAILDSPNGTPTAPETAEGGREPA